MNPTCTEAGNSEYWTCSVCGKHFDTAACTHEIAANSWVVQPTGHTAVYHAAVDPTCTEAGNSEYWSCSACGKYFDSEACANEIASNSWVISATGEHTYGDPTWSWVGVESAKATFTCGICEGQITVDATVTDAVTKEPTCTQTGIRTYTATAAFNGQSYQTTKDIVIAANVHTAVHTAAVNPTCTEAGNSEYWTCSVCGKHFDTAACTHEIAANSWVIPAAGHTPVHHEAAAPSAGLSGNTEYWECSACGKYFSDAACENEIADHDSVLVEPTGGVTGNTVSLKGEVSVNYYFYLPEEDAEDVASVTYSYGEGAYAKNDIEVEPDINDEYDVFDGANMKISCMVNARSMTEPITLEFKDAEGNVLYTDDSFKIIDYASQLAAASEKYQRLMCAMLDYGGKAQEFFGYRTDDLASNYIEDIDPDYDPDDSEVPTESETDKTDFAALKNANLTYGYRYVGSTLTATAKTRIRLFFAKTDADAAAGTAVTVFDKDNHVLYDNVVPYNDNSTYGYYCVDIDGVSAKNIFDTYTVVFTNGSDIVSGTYNAASYYRVATEAAKGVVQKMYLYCKAAIAALTPQG